VTGNDGLGASDLTLAVATLIERYGRDAVKREVAAATKRRRGAPKKSDWSLLHEQLQRDARELLSGKPFRTVADSQMAKDFADNHAGRMVSRESVKRRIRRKLKRSRDLYVLYNAFVLSWSESPWWVHLAVTEVLAEADASLGIWRTGSEKQKVLLDRYKATHGQPEDKMTFVALLDELRRASSSGMAPVLRPDNAASGCSHADDPSLREC
jgi:hypothetical protein